MKNKYDVALWIAKIGANIKTRDQYVSYLNLISNFKRQYMLSGLTDSELINSVYKPIQGIVFINGGQDEIKNRYL